MGIYAHTKRNALGRSGSNLDLPLPTSVTAANSVHIYDSQCLYLANEEESSIIF